MALVEAGLWAESAAQAACSSKKTPLETASLPLIQDRLRSHCSPHETMHRGYLNVR